PLLDLLRLAVCLWEADRQRPGLDVPGVPGRGTDMNLALKFPCRGATMRYDSNTEAGRSRPLSASETRFCKLWAETDNATRACIDAGYPHASDGAAAEAGSKLLRKPEIREYTDRLRDHAARAAQVTVDSLALGFRRSVEADITRLL